MGQPSMSSAPGVPGAELCSDLGPVAIMVVEYASGRHAAPATMGPADCVTGRYCADTLSDKLDRASRGFRVARRWLGSALRQHDRQFATVLQLEHLYSDGFSRCHCNKHESVPRAHAVAPPKLLLEPPLGRKPRSHDSTESIGSVRAYARQR